MTVVRFCQLNKDSLLNKLIIISVLVQKEMLAMKLDLTVVNIV